MRAHSNAFRLNISETRRTISLKLGQRLVLLLIKFNIAIVFFTKNPIRRVFPDFITYSIMSKYIYLTYVYFSVITGGV